MPTTTSNRLEYREIKGFKPEQREVLEYLVQAFERFVAQAVAPRMRAATVDAVHRFMGTTTDNVQTEIYLNGNTVLPARLTVPDDSSYAFHAMIVARRSDADDESAAYEFKGLIDRNAGVTALCGSVAKTVIHEDSAGWDVTIDADATNNALRIQVTGENGKSIGWVGHVNVVPITG